jgi:mannose-6-phosphate isomerase-like protein (cupin superfamily)
MPVKIKSPSIIKAAGNKQKIIEEYIGKVNSHNSDVSIARMLSPGGWIEPGQKPEFDEYTIVLKGQLNIKTENDETIVKAGEAIITKKGEWIQYSTPHPEGAEYISVCLPAFSIDTVHRDEK